MALALRLFLLLLLAVALPARAAQAAPLPAWWAEEHARKVSPAAQLHEDFQPPKPPAGVSAGRTFQTPVLVAAPKPSSHRRGENKPQGASKVLEASKHMDKKLSDLKGHRDAAGTSTGGDNIRKMVFCWGTACLIKMVAIVAGAALGLLICCAAIWYCCKRICGCSASSEEEPNSMGGENLRCVPSSPLLPLSALPCLQHRLEPFPKPTPPKRDPLPISPLVLFPGQN
ncbi:unnamed protein product [Coccothraustes coccothraustes]